MSFNTTTVRDQLTSSGLQEILDLEGLTELAVNQPGTIWFDRGHGWEAKAEPRCTARLCGQLANALSVLSDASTAIDFHNPLASVILPDGERGQIVLPPATEQGTVSLTFRKPSLKRFALEDYIATKRLSGAQRATQNPDGLNPAQESMRVALVKNDMQWFFRAAIQHKMNILLVGGTGSGKTTFMKALVDLYPAERRLFTIEDVHELSLPNHPNHVHLFHKEHGVTPKSLIASCMRMRPDHVLLAELRGDEAWNYLELLNTGHSGSITTIHANDCRSAFSRIAALVKQSEVGQTLDYEFILNTVKVSIDVICFFKDSFMKELWFHPEEKNALLAR